MIFLLGRCQIGFVVDFSLIQNRVKRRGNGLTISSMEYLALATDNMSILTRCGVHTCLYVKKDFILHHLYNYTRLLLISET